MKLLFVMRHNGYVRNWEWVIRDLLRRGHRVHLGFERARDTGEIVDRLDREFPGLTHGRVPTRTDRFAVLATTLGGAIDYVRYTDPIYEDAPMLRARGRRSAPRVVRTLLDNRWLRRRPGFARSLDRALRSIASWIPNSPSVEATIAGGGYDVVMATPLVSSPSEHEYLRVARRQGRFTILPVTSWDNLTNKGLVQVVPDRVYVWNESQRREAIELHGLSSDSVVAVGAHSYDHWFGWRSTRTREAFCAEVGLDPGRPVLLYVCSSGFICKDEGPLVRRWLNELRASRHSLLRDAGILVRPHPQMPSVWESNPLDGFSNVSVWPPLGADPLSERAKADYYDSLFHAAAVVGVNTTALVEAAIVGRRTFTVITPETRGTQEGTLHFHHLLRENGGPLSVATTFEEHAEHLAVAIQSPGADASVDSFVRSFVRPRGIDTPCAPLLVDDLERSFAQWTRSIDPHPRRLAIALVTLLAWVVDRRTPRKKRARFAGRADGGVPATNPSAAGHPETQASVVAPAD